MEWFPLRDDGSNVKGLLRRVAPGWARRWHMARRERAALDAVPPMECDTRKLAKDFGPRDLRALLDTAQSSVEWPDVDRDLSAFAISERSDGLNAGDRRALFQILGGLGVRSMLEIGTHVGASTVYAAAALARNSANTIPTMVTVDVVDVNDPDRGPWRVRGSRYSPKEMVSALGFGEWVRFRTCSSLEFLKSDDRLFDFVFLDGDHGAATVYRKIPLALRRLEAGGFILLHDCFPDLRPLWSNGIVIPGPWLAVARLRSEGVKIALLPLGELPWPTKLGSRVSSLALLVGTGD